MALQVETYQASTAVELDMYEQDFKYSKVATLYTTPSAAGWFYFVRISGILYSYRPAFSPSRTLGAAFSNVPLSDGAKRDTPVVTFEFLAGPDQALRVPYRGFGDAPEGDPGITLWMKLSYLVSWTRIGVG